MNSIKPPIFVSLAISLLLEFAYWVNGFISWIIIICITAFLGFCLVVLLYNYFESIYKNEVKFNILIILVLLPFYSLNYNPTKMLYQYDQNQIVLEAITEGGMADRGGEIILYKNGTCFWISNGFFYQTTEKGKYQFNNQTLTFKFKDEPNYNMIIKESTSETPYLCDTTIKEPNFSNCFIVTNNVLSKKQ